MVSVSRDLEDVSVLAAPAVVVRESIEQTSQSLNVHQRSGERKERAGSDLRFVNLASVPMDQHRHLALYNATPGRPGPEFPFRGRRDVFSVDVRYSGTAHKGNIA